MDSMVFSLAGPWSEAAMRRSGFVLTNLPLPRARGKANGPASLWDIDRYLPRIRARNGRPAAHTARTGKGVHSLSKRVTFAAIFRQLARACMRTHGRRKRGDILTHFLPKASALCLSRDNSLFFFTFYNYRNVCPGFSSFPIPPGLPILPGLFSSAILQLAVFFDYFVMVCFLLKGGRLRVQPTFAGGRPRSMAGCRKPP
ncbi:hypothetical protein [Solidesulfovibrio magneticus]|uniref:hypothetical protein n=1 Tax=Solidesulfovibrio magneticus TaxID=184917 RepID=UPI001305152D|nr:hypothetical protein [Solidesulfovibrio magneticus]